MWSLFEDEKELSPLVFSNGKSQADIVKEVIDAINQGYKIIFIKGMPGTGKSAVALNLARKLGKTSIVVPIKSLQEQYIKDYTDKKYVLKNKSTNPEKLKISSVLGRQNFKCKYLEENEIKSFHHIREKNSTLTEVFQNQPSLKKTDNKTCDNEFLPCKIEIKEKNLRFLKEYIQKNPDVDISDFDSIEDIRRMTIAPVCPYWSPILPIEFTKFKDAKKTSYIGLNNRTFTYHERTPGCKYYEQYKSYSNSDVIIFNSLKYKIETLMDRKPQTELEVIDECDDFLDSFTIEEQININKLQYSLSMIFSSNPSLKKLLNELIDITNTIKISKKFEPNEIYDVKGTLVEDLLTTILNNLDLMDLFELDEHSYLYHLDKVARSFSDFLNETFFSIEKKDNNITINLVTTNIEKRFNELVEKNKIFVMMSGTIHSESVLKNIFGIKKYKIIEAEIEHQGELLKPKNGYEVDCSYESFKSNRVTREQYLKTLSKCVSIAKKPALVHVTAFSDLPNDFEKQKYSLENLPSKEQLIEEQKQDPLNKRVQEFKDKKTDILFTTKCSRGIDFPGDICNSIIITRFPYPNISSIFWKILKKTHPMNFMSFYIDKANRELLQKIYRGLRSKDDKLCLLSPDKRVIEFEIK